MEAVGICLLCSSHNGFPVDVLGPFPDSLKIEMGESYVGSSDDKCWIAFILSKVLRIPEEMCEEFVICFSSANTFRLCHSCTQLVSANALYRQRILECEREVDAIDKHIQNAMVQSSTMDVMKGCSEMEDREENFYNIEGVITKLFSALDSFIPEAGIDEAAENNSKENVAGGATEEFNGTTQERDVRLENYASSSSQDNVAQRDNRGHRPDDIICNPDKTHFGFDLEGGHRDYVTQSNHSSGGNQQDDIDEIVYMPSQRIENFYNFPGWAPHPQMSTNNWNNTGSESRVKIDIDEILFLPNGAFKQDVHQCKMCPRKFSRQLNLIRHVRCHTAVKPFQCRVCTKAFAMSASLSGHMRTHTQEKPFKCDTCLNTFAHAGQLNRHVVAVHSELKALKCRICRKTCATSSILIGHMRDHANPHKCVMCEKHFSRADILENHLRAHTREKPFYCVYCGMEYAREESAKRHMPTCRQELRLYKEFGGWQ